MAIYPDKRGGKLTGRFRVELQRGVDRYRKRWDSLAEAQADETRVLDAWAAGEIPGEPLAPKAPEKRCATLEEAYDLAKGQLWNGNSTEDTAWAHMDAIMEIVGRDKPLDDIDTIVIDRIIQRLSKAGKSNGTVNRYLSHLRTFLVWAKSRKYRTVPIDNDEIAFSWKEEEEGRIRWISPEEEAKLLELVPDNVGKVIQIAIATGCRRDELLTARLDQINGHRLHIWHTKTRKPRTVPMSPETTAMLTELIKTGTMPTQRNLRSWWDRAKLKMGLGADKDFVFHACRHTCATRLLDAGVNLLVIKEWLGHKRIETTLRYTHVKPQNLEDALKLVGEYQRGLAQKPSGSAVPHTPPQAISGGEIAGLAAAA